MKNKTNPVTTKMATGLVLFGLGDLTCQFCIDKKKGKWDHKRTMRQGLIAGLWINPVNQVWFNYFAPWVTLSRFLNIKKSFPFFINNVYRAFFSFCIVSPIITVSFLIFDTILKDKSAKNVYKTLENKVYVT